MALMPAGQLSARDAMTNKNGEIQGFVKEQVAEAQKRFVALQTEAEKTFKTWAARGQELQATTTKRATAFGNGLRKKAESFQSRLVQAAGVATQGQIRALSRELNRLSKKVEALIEKKNANKPDARA
jgi:predicted  nucleic acid-binding Zn-ribbon protein